MSDEGLIGDHHWIGNAVEIDLLGKVGVVLIDVDDEFGGVV